MELRESDGCEVDGLAEGLIVAQKQFKNNVTARSDFYFEYGFVEKIDELKTTLAIVPIMQDRDLYQF